MERESGLKWLFMDLNSYFASVEQQETPSLRGKPVAVIPMDTDYTCAIAASYEAKAYGIKTGTMIKDAKRMCPSLSCVLARHDKYVEYHNRIIEEVILHTPINQICSIDELSSRLPPSKRSVEAATQVAMNIKHGLWDNVGSAINCSIGLAPNALLAKIAGDMQKPDGLVVLRQEDLPGPLLDLSLTDLPGIGRNMERRLHRANVRTVEDFWVISPKHARKIWGSVQGERFWYWLHGYDFEAPDTGHVMIGHSRILDPDLRLPAQARQMSRRLLSKATQRLRRKAYFARALCLKVRTIHHLRWVGEIRMPPARDPFTFLQNLDQLWSDMLCYFYKHHYSSSAIGRDQLRFKKVSVVLHHLGQHDSFSYDLFETCHHEHLEVIRQRDALTQALDTLNQKYKKETVTLGLPPKTLAGHVGTKIAFSRVPEQEEFWS